MLIQSRSRLHLSENDTTPEAVYRKRRQILKAMGLAALGLGSAGVPGPAAAQWFGGLFGGDDDEVWVPRGAKALDASKRQDPKPDLEITPEIKAISHNNFYEFGENKTDPVRNSREFQVEPWTVDIRGQVEKPMTVDLWELINSTQLEERIYRLRCVEAWSMVIPWIGFELAKLLKPAKPTSKAKFVAFRTLYDPEQMPALESPFMGGSISFPYREGMRIDEAMHPLTLMAVGMYGRTLPPQNGAPLRLMAPWKYGFKAIKSIVRIDLVEDMPPTSWAMMAPHEYGFYANVNPDKSHPRWSQATERFIGEGRFSRRQETLPYNGYAEEVAHLYD